MSDTAIIKVQAPPRGGRVQPAVTFHAAQVVCSYSWGLQPATALIDWVTATAVDAIVPLASLTIEVGGHVFYGICKSVVPVVGSDGFSQMQEFVDSRDFLMWDHVYCRFNLRDHRIVNGVYTRRYKHLLPADHNTNHYTYTNAPYTGAQILDFLFASSTTESPWVRVYHAALNNAVYDLDFVGRKLGLAVQEVSERCGTTFTLQGGRYRLVWCVKGISAVPVFPANSDNRRLGTALSGWPTRVRVLGDRNRYQVMDMTLEPDWKSAWQTFYDFGVFVNDIYAFESTDGAVGSIPAGTRYNAIPGDVDQTIGHMLATERARLITVEQYAVLRDADPRAGDGNTFRDFRKYQGQSRLQMPVALYLSQVLFRAFRVPSTFTFNNWHGQTMSAQDLDITDRGIAEVTHNPATGAMTYYADMDGEQNGYVIVKGYQIFNDSLKTVRPEYIDLNKWKSAQALWQAVGFQVDNSGEGDRFIILEQQAITAADLLSFSSIDGVAQNYATLRVGATVTAATVKAALTFEGERFSHIAGTGTRDDCEVVPALNADCVLQGGVMREMFYANGLTGTQMAATLANNLLNRQFYYQYGGYTVQGSNVTQLTDVIDRVTVRKDGQGGLTEEVDFTTERTRAVSIAPNGRVVMHLEPEREFERRQQLTPLFPGQRELRQEANQIRASATFLRQNPKVLRNLVENYHLLMGLDSAPDSTMLKGATDTPLPVGSPLLRDATNKTPWMPDVEASAARSDTPVFLGATVLSGESAAGAVRYTRTGNGGVILVRVKGPVAANESVGFPADTDNTDLAVATNYLQASAHTAVGTALEAVAEDVIQLVQVRVTGGGGGTSSPWHLGEWLSTTSYPAQKQVARGVIGEFVSMQNVPAGIPPETGAPYWHCVTSWPAIGAWG